MRFSDGELATLARAEPEALMALGNGLASSAEWFGSVRKVLDAALARIVIAVCRNVSEMPVESPELLVPGEGPNQAN